MQSLLRVARTAKSGFRGFASDVLETQESRWAKYSRKKPPTKEEIAKKGRFDYWGLVLLGPVGCGFMIYDIFVGLEHHEFHPIPPYPWMRWRAVPDMPWGENSLFEFKQWVATEWPPAEGAEDHAHH